MKLCTFFRELRRELDVNQRTMAAALGVSQPCLSRIESGVAEPKGWAVLFAQQIARTRPETAQILADFDSSLPTPDLSKLEGA